MKMGMRVAISTLVVGTLILVGCGSNGAGGGTLSSATDGTIEIISVDPSTGLVNESPTSFTVEVAYTATGGRAELNIGFNTGENVDWYIMVSEATTVVAEGSGSHTFSVSATPKDWGSEGDFRVYVSISEYPHPDTWSPLGSDRSVLEF